MKENYNLGGDLFVIFAFISFVIGGITKLWGIKAMTSMKITPDELLGLSLICLLFSISLSLLDLSKKE